MYWFVFATVFCEINICFICIYVCVCVYIYIYIYMIYILEHAHMCPSEDFFFKVNLSPVFSSKSSWYAINIQGITIVYDFL